MMRYNWPGNVRELENFIRRYLIIANEEAMIAELEQAIADHAAPSLAAAAVEGAIFETAPAPAIPVGRPNGATKALRELKREAERKAICSALEANKWRRTQAAKALHISYKALLYKIRDLDIC
jgi:DNA-binding NtrC family response regulator